MDRPDAMNTVKAFCEAWGTRDIERILAFLSEDCFYHNIPIEPVVGKADIRRFLSGFLADVEFCELEIHDIALSPTGAVMTERTDRFQIGGRRGELPVMGIFEFEHGEIVRWRDYYDQPTMDQIWRAL